MFLLVHSLRVNCQLPPSWDFWYHRDELSWILSCSCLPLDNLPILVCLSNFPCTHKIFQNKTHVLFVSCRLNLQWWKYWSSSTPLSLSFIAWSISKNLVTAGATIFWSVACKREQPVCSANIFGQSTFKWYPSTLSQAGYRPNWRCQWMISQQGIHLELFKLEGS